MAPRAPLRRYLPAPGLRWAIGMKPREMAADPTWRAGWEELVEARDLEAFVASTGVDPEHVEELWLGGYDLGLVVVLDGRQVGRQVTERILSRARSSSEISTEFDDLQQFRLVVEDEPWVLIHQAEHFVAWAQRDPTLGRLVAARAQGRLPTTPSALEREFIRPYEDFASDSAVRAFAVGPLPEATHPLVQAFAGGVLCASIDGDSLVVQGRARGAWALEDATGPRTWVGALLAQPIALALGWGAPDAPLQIDCSPAQSDSDGMALDECSLAGRWPAARLFSAAHRVTSAELTEIFE